MEWHEPEEIARQLAEAISRIPPKIKRRGRILWEGEIDELSFKAGRKEVMDWIKSHGDWDCGHFIFGFDIDQDIWNAKLKEWGINP